MTISSKALKTTAYSPVCVTLVWCLSVSLLAGTGHAGGFSEEQKGRLLQTLAEMSAVPALPSRGALEEQLSREGLHGDSWARLFETHLTGGAFTVNHAFHLETLLSQGFIDTGRVARVAAAFAATAARVTWSTGLAEKGGFSLGLPFLERMFNNLSPALRKAVADGINDALREKKIDLSHALSGTEPVAPAIRLGAMQLCVTLGVFAEPARVTQWLVVPESTAAFFTKTGIWLFDGGALGSQHLGSLESIVSVLPRELHALVAIIAPDPLGLENPASLLRVPGTLLPISVAPMELTRDIASLPPFLPVPPIPDFTAMALEQVMALIQELHLPARPDLLHRRQVVTSYLGANPATPLAAMLPPEILQGAVGDFFSYLGLLWMTHSEMLLEIAVVYLQQGNREPLYALFLLADLLSLRGDTTMLFRADARGVISGRETAIRRAFLGPASSHVNGIAIGGQLLQVDVSDFATLLEMH